MSLRRARTIVEAMREVERLPGFVRQTALRILAGKVRDLVEGAWDAGRDPYGGRWAPKKDGSMSRLYDTGRMRGSLRVYVQEQSVVVFVEHPPFEFHQRGTRRMVARPILPTEGRGVPASWREAVQDVAREAVQALER